MTQSSTAYRDIQTGFSVVPRVAGDRVTLEIAPQRETPGAYGRGSANTQQIVTTATGRLGEWIELGSMTQTTAAEGSGILSSRSAARRDNRGVWVKVDVAQRQDGAKTRFFIVPRGHFPEQIRDDFIEPAMKL